MAAKARPATAPRPGPQPAARAKRRGMPKLRLLPVTIFVAALMLSVRVNDIWRDITSVRVTALTVSESEAQQPPPPGGRKRGQKSPAMPENAGGAPASGSAATASSGTPGQAPGQPEPAPPAVSPGASGEGEPPTFTQNEVDVLQKLAERREELTSRQRDLDLRENLVKAAEGRIDKKIAEMKALQTNVESMLKQVNEQDDSKLKSLVKIYETMKPKDAAKIFEALDMPVLLSVMTRMKEQKVAPIMESMDPMKAKTITDAMSVRRAAKAEGQGG